MGEYTLEQRLFEEIDLLNEIIDEMAEGIANASNKKHFIIVGNKYDTVSADDVVYLYKKRIWEKRKWLV